MTPAEIVEHKYEVYRKIIRLERECRFDEDVEDDPPTIPLKPGEVDYLKDSFSARLKYGITSIAGHLVLWKDLLSKDLIISSITGLEHLNGMKTGAIITCNHFNQMDSLAMQVMYERSALKKKRLYRVIREGNYSAFKGLIGMQMKYYNTIPLSENITVMKEAMTAINTILRRGDVILIYPEQGMWYNYKKPRPLKTGAARFAVTADVPIVPVFITMSDSDKISYNGDPVQKYDIHISKPIYPDKAISKKDNIQHMTYENYNVWKRIYEEVYQIPLKYNTINQDFQFGINESVNK